MSLLIVDSNYASLKEAIEGTTAPLKVQKTLVLVDVRHISFDGLLHKGQIVVHEALESDVKDIFGELLEIGFPIASAIPMVDFGWDDEVSMIANNASGFNYRFIMDTDRLSNHSYGEAVDINPVQNPYRTRSGMIYPPGAVYDTSVPGTFVDSEKAVMLFKDRGWEWGGNWTEVLDRHHFEKLPA